MKLNKLTRKINITETTQKDINFVEDIKQDLMIVLPQLVEKSQIYGSNSLQDMQAVELGIKILKDLCED